MAKSSAERLRRFYRQFSGEDRVLIAIVADPDSMASAMAVKRLLWRKVAQVTIASVNVVKRPDNVAMVNLLRLDIKQIKEVDLQKQTRVVMVDSQPDHNPELAALCPQVIIDHHPDTGASAPFSDIRPKYGANASILTEYLRAARIKPSAKLATALFHAIKTDTSNFERQSIPEDVRAFQFLYRHINIHLARKIERSEIRLDFLKYFKAAISEMKLRKRRAFVHLGTVPNPDVGVLVADFFMRVIGISWSLVSMLYENRLVIILRNDGLQKNAGKLAKDSFGHMGSAGGHKSMARAEIELDRLKGVCLEDSKQVNQWIITAVEKRAKNEPNVPFSKEHFTK